MAHILPDDDAERERFLPRPREGYTESFDGGTCGGGVPWVPADTPVGWTCPRCGHCYAPWVPVCHRCPEPPAFIAKEDGG